jgi:hypothetical protein
MPGKSAPHDGHNWSSKSFWAIFPPEADVGTKTSKKIKGNKNIDFLTNFFFILYRLIAIEF